MIRNNVAMYIHYSAWDAANNTGKAGDVANHTLKIIVDGVVSDPDNSPAEIVAGEYRLLLTAAESNGAKFICLAGVSSTADVYIIPAMVITDLLVSGAAFVGCYTAWDTSANTPKTADAGNHTITIAQDNASAGATNSPSQVSAVNAPGLYKISVTAGEAAGKAVSILGVSSTGDINIIPTELALFTVDYPAVADVENGVVYAETTLTGTLAVASQAAIEDVRLGTVYNDGNFIGTAAIPGASDVRLATAIDATTGTLAFLVKTTCAKTYPQTTRLATTSPPSRLTTLWAIHMDLSELSSPGPRR